MGLVLFKATEKFFNVGSGRAGKLVFGFLHQLLLLVVLYDHSKALVRCVEGNALLLICKVSQLIPEHELFGAFWHFVILIVLGAEALEQISVIRGQVLECELLT